MPSTSTAITRWNIVVEIGRGLEKMNNDVVQCSERIYSGFSKHGGRLAFPDPVVNFSPAFD
jgi:hypothetical protein